MNTTVQQTYRHYLELTMGHRAAAASLTLADAMLVRQPAAAGRVDGPFTIQQAADYLGISSEKLYRLVAQGEIRHYRVGRAIRFTREHLDAYQREMTEAARRRQSDSERPDRL
jgi:excisionase family DNA binding protein